MGKCITNIEEAKTIYGEEFESYLSDLSAKFLEVQTSLKGANEEATALEYFKWLDFNYLTEVNKITKELAAEVKSRSGDQKINQAIVVGMGGSGINSLVLKNSLSELNPEHDDDIEVIVQNNLDPSSMLARLRKLGMQMELKHTLFVLVSKSGSTDEVKRNTNTILNVLAAIEEQNISGAKACDLVHNGQVSDEARQRALKAFASRLVFITEPRSEDKKNFFHKVADELKSKTGVEVPFLDNHPMIGGRFSMFSPVGMFAAELMGLSSDKLLAGAKSAADRFFAAASIQDSTIAQLAALDTYLFTRKGFTNRYSMVYCDSLEGVNKFRSQLKGESLSKNGLDSTIHVAGIGTVNHHSDLELILKDNNGVLLEQLYFGQPAGDHNNADTGLEIYSDLIGQSNHQSLKDNHINPLKNYLVEKKAPVLQTEIAEQNEEALAEFLMQDMLVTVVQAGLQDEAGATEKLDLAIRQWAVEDYKKSLRK